ncbi:retrovirus-related pol polyprotein from transposon TNT 1-94 [Tanacetum coccineum]|uniref:Retrovirus-related pol polyprotein from transposon TNT 1-94 n=1 Tax=Tanacetum coccineum TaxID=301880 RepID=A0ABQ5E1F1_9ASTR
MTPPHFNTYHSYQSSYNNPQLQQQFSPSHKTWDHFTHNLYSSHYPSQNPIQSFSNHHHIHSVLNKSSNLNVPQVLCSVFSPRDDPIACLNKAMAFLTAVASSRFPSTNNQLRTSSNPRNQATIQDGRVTVQQVQGRQGQNYSGTTYKGNATSSRGNTTSGQARVVKCYNCQGEGHMARQCTQPKRPRNAAWYKEKAMLAEAQEAGQILDEEQLAFLADPGIPAGQAQIIIPHNAAFQTEDLDTYDSDCDDLSTAQAVLMANISNYGSDIISEVPNSKTYLNDMDNQVRVCIASSVYKIKTAIGKLKDTIQSLSEGFQDCTLDLDSDVRITWGQESLSAHDFVRYFCVAFVKTLALFAIRGVDLLSSDSRRIYSKDLPGSDFLNTKDEGSVAIIKCIKNIQVRLKATVRNVQTDNGTGFVNQTLREWYENVDIMHQTSVAHTPQQNDVVERRNWTLVEATRTMLIFSKAPLFLCTGLVSNPVSQQPCIPPIRDDWDRLFQPMFDEYLNPPTIDVSPVQEAATPRPKVLAGFKESLKTPTFHNDPLNESPNEDSTSHGSSSNVRQIHTPLEHLGRWTKNNPITNVIGTVENAFLTLVEPKNFKQAMTKPSLIDAMQEEIHEFERLKVWELVPYPDNVFLIKLKWINKVKTDESGRNRGHSYLRSKCRSQEYDDLPNGRQNGFLKCSKRLYGLKQAPRAWYDMLSSFLISQQFPKGAVDPTLFTRHTGNDLLLRHLHKSKYAAEIVKKYGLNSTDSVETPMIEIKKLDEDLQGKQVDATLNHGSMLPK